jgi:hypothetical protein
MFSATEHKQKARIGPYERMLCRECEDKFGKLDSYGSQVLLKRFDSLFKEEVISHNITAYQSEDGTIDQDLLQRFFVSVLWRASVTEHIFYRQVSLGKLEELAAQAVDCDRPLSEKFSVALFRLPDQTEAQTLLQKLIRNPFQDRMDGINGYRFYFGKIGAFITADSRGLPRTLAKIALKQGTTVGIIGGTFMAESDHTAMKGFMASAKASKKLRLRPA